MFTTLVTQPPKLANLGRWLSATALTLQMMLWRPSMRATITILRIRPLRNTRFYTQSSPTGPNSALKRSWKVPTQRLRLGKLIMSMLPMKHFKMPRPNLTWWLQTKFLWPREFKIFKVMGFMLILRLLLSKIRLIDLSVLWAKPKKSNH